MNPDLFKTIYEFLDNLAHEYPRLDWVFDDDGHVVIWEEEA